MKKKDIYIRLRTIRIAKGYSSAKSFVERNNLSYNTYIAHESGKIEISDKFIKKYAQILNVPEEWLKYGDITLNTEESKHTTSQHIIRKTLEPVVMPIILTTILKAIDRYDSEIDYDKLYKKCGIILSEILSKSHDIDELRSFISTAVSFEKDNLISSILKSENEKKV